MSIPAMAQTNLLPDAPGKAEVVAACDDCHGIMAVVHNHLTADQWRDTLAQMEMEGATLPPGNIDLMVRYLTTYFGPVPQPAPAPAAK